MGVGRTLAGSGSAVWGWGVCECLRSSPCTWQLPLPGGICPSAHLLAAQKHLSQAWCSCLCEELALAAGGCEDLGRGHPSP